MLAETNNDATYISVIWDQQLQPRPNGGSQLTCVQIQYINLRARIGM